MMPTSSSPKRQTAAPVILEDDINQFLKEHGARKSGGLLIKASKDSSGDYFHPTRSRASSLSIAVSASREHSSTTTPSTISPTVSLTDESPDSSSFTSDQADSTKATSVLGDTGSIVGDGHNNGQAAGAFDPPVLPCEFVGYDNCEREFPITRVAEWIDHVVQEHLHHQYPQRTLCWFCDDEDFQSPSDVQSDLRDTYHQRMQHIAQHFRLGCTKNMMRPDFHFLDHLKNARLISDEVARAAMSYHELPPEYLYILHQDADP